MKNIIRFAVIMFFLVSLPLPVYAQASDLRIHLQKIFGYGWGNSIQGRFSIRIIGDTANVARVVYYIDEEVLGETFSDPFDLSFSTDDYSPGAHSLYAVIHLQDGQIQDTPSITYQFLSREDANRQLTRILVGIGGALVGTMLIMAVLQMLLLKKKPVRVDGSIGPRSYGILGGTICPKCGRPFPRHIWGVNFLVGRLDRCEHCHSWVMTKRAMPDALRNAEEAQSTSANHLMDKKKPEPDRRDMLEDTKFIDHL